MPKISIIVPVFNKEKYLDKCLSSLVNQTYKDLEIIIINDGSTDNSALIIDDYYIKYPQIIKKYSQNNIGVSAARNFGINVASGQYISFIDADDFLEENLFKLLIPYLEKNYDLIKFKAKILDRNLKEIDKISGPTFKKLNGEEAFSKLYVDDLLMDSACLYLFKRQYIINNNFTFLENTYHEDFGLMPIIIASANSIVSTNIYGYNYISVEDGIMRDSNYLKTLKKANDLFLHYDRMLDYVKVSEFSDKTINYIKSFYTNAILLKVTTLEKKDQKKYITEIKNRKLYKNIHINNMRTFIKKILLKININLYLFFIRRI